MGRTYPGDKVSLGVEQVVGEAIAELRDGRASAARPRVRRQRYGPAFAVVADDAQMDDLVPPLQTLVAEGSTRQLVLFVEEGALNMQPVLGDSLRAPARLDVLRPGATLAPLLIPAEAGRRVVGRLDPLALRQTRPVADSRFYFTALLAGELFTPDHPENRL